MKKSQKSIEQLEVEPAENRALKNGPVFDLPKESSLELYPGPTYGFNELVRCEKFEDRKITCELWIGKQGFHGDIHLGQYMVKLAYLPIF